MTLDTIEACDKQLAEIHELSLKTKTYKTQQKLIEKLDATLDRRLELAPSEGVSEYSTNVNEMEVAFV